MNKRTQNSAGRQGWRRVFRMGAALTVTAGLVLAVSACGSSGNGGGGDKIVIGASIPISGDLAGFGSFLKWGYTHAVDEVNAAGGIEVDGKKKQVELKILDDKTDPNTTSSNTDRLISQDGVAAMLGSCTPVLVNAGAVVADRNRTPLVTGCDPLEAFKSVKDWQYAWDLFFDEPDLASAPFKTLQDTGTQTNKKVAILHDNGPDGQVVGGQLWPSIAQQFGYDVVLNQEFPVAATTFSSTVTQAKNSGADVVLVDAVTPQAISMRKEMAAQGFKPKVLVMEKGGEPVQFAQALGGLADGILVGGYWDPSFPYPGAAELKTQFEQETGQTASQHIADSEAAAAVLFDAIKRAGSTDKDKINDALKTTDLQTVVGPIKFDANHTSKLPIVELQWQGGETKIVWPTDQATGKFLFPLP
jgi:branched-chain amino acid transport system substrate-binding protein